jgi:site-specific DNA-cytosine methylase
MKVLIACEFSGVVRRAFRAAGHNAWSCDLLPAEDRSHYHLHGDVRQYLDSVPGRVDANWDLLIAHPPCTHLAVSGARWFKDKQAEQEDALGFVRLLMGAPVEHIAIENPISVISSRIRKPDQIIQPWMFGHGEVKATCLWLKNLPKLEPTNVVEGRVARVHREPPSPDRWKNRSRTFEGIAQAMAAQWTVPVLRELRQAVA